MKQVALDSNLSVKKARKRELLGRMECVAPWVGLVACIAPCAAGHVSNSIGGSYQGIDKHAAAKPGIHWKLNKHGNCLDVIIDKLGKLKSSLLARRRTSASRYQALAWVCQSPLARPEGQDAAFQHAVFAVKLVDDQASTGNNADISASENRSIAMKRREMLRRTHIPRGVFREIHHLKLMKLASDA